LPLVATGCERGTGRSFLFGDFLVILRLGDLVDSF
jgi:hypothetical protein